MCACSRTKLADVCSAQRSTSSSIRLSLRYCPVVVLINRQCIAIVSFFRACALYNNFWPIVTSLWSSNVGKDAALLGYYWYSDMHLTTTSSVAGSCTAYCHCRCCRLGTLSDAMMATRCPAMRGASFPNLPMYTHEPWNVSYGCWNL